MPSDKVDQSLSRLWIIHEFSLVSYLAYAPPWWTEDDGAAAQLLRDVHQDQQRLADRIGKMIVHYGGRLPSGKFPNRFTTLHDLASHFIWSELVTYQERTVEAIEQLLPQLPAGTVAEAIGQECLGAAKAHLDAMREIKAGELPVAV
jgi:hypothetical protein